MTDYDTGWREQIGQFEYTLVNLFHQHDPDGIGAAAHIEERIHNICSLITCGDLYAASQMRDYLTRATMAVKQDEEENFGGIQEALQAWSGDAAEAFKTYFHQLQDASDLLADLIKGLQIIIESHVALVTAMRKDFVDLMKKTLDGIAAARSDQWEVGATIAGAVAAVAGAAATAMTEGAALAAFAIATEVTNAGSSVAVQEDGAEDELTVIIRFVDSGEDMIKHIDTERYGIERGLRKFDVFVTDTPNPDDPKHGTRLTQVRPDLGGLITAPSFNPADFRLPDDIQGAHAAPTSHKDLAPTPKAPPANPADETTDGRDDHPISRGSRT